MSKAIERIEKRLSGKKAHPFDFINNPIFFDPRPEDNTKYWQQLMAMAKVGYVARSAVSRGLDLAFVQGSMSNGSEAYDFAENNKEKILANTKARTGKAVLTTQRLKHNVASAELNNNVVQPNRTRNFHWADVTERTYPDKAVVAPVDWEGPIRVIQENHAVSQGISFQDAAFEAYWGPTVVDTTSMHPYDDHAYSRYANTEELEADAIQCGFLDDLRTHIPHGEGKHYEIKDVKGRDVTLSDRAWETAKHIVDVVERGFVTDYAVAALVCRFAIDDWLDNPENSPLEMSKVHPILKNRTNEDRQRMKQLKEIMLPYIAQKCADWVPYQEDDFLKSYFEQSVLPHTKPLAQNDIEAIKKDIFAYQPRGGYVNPRYGRGEEAPDRRRSQTVSEQFQAVTRPAKRRGTGERHFERTANIFEDSHYKRLDIWEQGAISFALGAMEGFRLPDAAPRAAFYACEPKGGLRAKSWADKHDIHWLKEAQSTADQVEDKGSFYRKVIEANVKQSSKRQEKLGAEKVLKDCQVRNVVTSLDMLEIDEVIQKNRQFVATPGPSRLSERARLAMQMEWLDRNAEVLVLREGWQHHPTEVQMMMRSVLHATGQVERPYEGGKYRMKIFVDGAEGPVKQDLYDLISTLASSVEEQLDRSPPVPDRASYVAMARLLEIADKLSDPGRRNFTISSDPQTGATSKKTIISWSLVDSDFYTFWYDDPKKRADLSAIAQDGHQSLRDRVREKLLTSGITFFEKDDVSNDLAGLDEEYSRAWSEAHGVDLDEQRRRPPTDKKIKWGPSTS